MTSWLPLAQGESSRLTQIQVHTCLWIIHNSTLHTNQAQKNKGGIACITFLNSSFDLNTASWQEPTLPEGTEVKKGESPNKETSNTLVGG
jgi:hypothetical protein